MRSPPVSVVLALALGVAVVLLPPMTVHAEGSSAMYRNSTNKNMTREGQGHQCSPLQSRQDLLDSRLNGIQNSLTEKDSRLNEMQTQLNKRDTRLDGLDTRLNTQQNQVSDRFNRMDSRFDEIVTELAVMKKFLQTRMEAMEEKVELATAAINPHEENDQVSYLLPLVRGDYRPMRMPKSFKGCQEAMELGWQTSGIYTITPDRNTSIDVHCEQQLDGGGWTVFQVRKDGNTDFYRDWNSYKTGFGDLSSEFWLGNYYINILTKQHDQQLKIELTSPDGDVEFADYSHFYVADESAQYTLNITGYSGGSPPGDSMAYHNGHMFSTKDADNDAKNGASCAQDRHSGWWYNSCMDSNLNGQYGSTVQYKGLNWYKWKGYSVSMKSTRMMIRKRL